MQTEEHKVISIDLPEGELELTARFEIHTETYPAEPYSHGGGRGNETAVTAIFVDAPIGALTADRNMLVKMIGEDALQEYEAIVEEDFALGGMAA